MYCRKCQYDLTQLHRWRRLRALVTYFRVVSKTPSAEDFVLMAERS